MNSTKCRLEWGVVLLELLDHWRQELQDSNFAPGVECFVVNRELAELEAEASSVQGVKKIPSPATIYWSGSRDPKPGNESPDSD